MLAGGVAAPAATGRGFDLGFNEPLLTYAPANEQALLIDRMRDVHAGRIRIAVQWNEVAGPTEPSRAAAEDPDWPGYRWTGLDAAVRESVAGGLRPLLVVERAPRWAEGDGRPRDGSALPGSWRPSAQRLSEFLRALARRYDGGFTPAGAGEPLPAVRDYQVWNEPNLDGQLLPQHIERGGRTIPVGAVLYRRMLHKGYAAIKAVSPSNVVVAAGLAPYGDYPSGTGLRTPPVFFARQFLCLSRQKSGCATKPRFDVFAVNVYPPTPASHARNADDLALADMPRIRSLLSRSAARRTTRAKPDVPLWVTEFSWATTKPDYSYVVSEKRQARYFVDALYHLWRQGVRTAFWWRLRDGPRDALGYQVDSGFFTRASRLELDRAKPIVNAAQLPFVARRAGGRVRIWVLPTRSGRVHVERRTAAGWTRVASFDTTAGHPVVRAVDAARSQSLRARQGRITSLARRAG